METLKDMVERNKEKVKIFLQENTATFIENTSQDYFFCYIKEIHSNFIIVKGFAGRRKGETDKIYFLDILRLEEYEEREE